MTKHSLLILFSTVCMQSLQVKTSESAFTKPTWTQEEQAIWNSIEKKLDHIKKGSQEHEKYLEEKQKNKQ